MNRKDNYDLFFFKKTVSIAVIIVNLSISNFCVAQTDTLQLNADTSQVIRELSDLSLEELLNIKIVVGSRDNEKSLFSSSNPITVITSEDIRKTGLTDLGLVLQRLLPFINAPRPSLNDGTDHSAPVFMRGLNADQILVLINGKRRHITSLVHTNIIGRGSTSIDFNSIPPEAVEKIEVLRDGASAQYGSDAIAGIINIVLKEKTNSYFISQYGQTIENDGASGQISAHLSDKIKKNGFYNFTISYRQKNATNRSGFDERQQYFSNQTSQNQSFINNPHQTFRYGETSSDNISVISNLEVPISKKSTIYSFGTFNYREGESGLFYRRPNDDGNVRSVYPDGFLPLLKPVISDGSGLIGHKTELNGWKIDISLQYGANSFRFNLNNSINASMGISSPTNFYCGSLISSNTSLNIDLVKKFKLGLFSPLTFAWGSEMRIENFKILKGNIASYSDGGVRILDGPNAGNTAPVGAQGFPGFRPEDETNKNRTNKSLYVDLEQSFWKKISIGAAGRFESYSDFGSKLNGKASLRYEPFQGITLRVSANTGFKAPSLSQSYYSYSQSIYISGTPYSLGIFPVDNAISKALGAQPLKPETSKNINIGLGTKIRKKVFVSVDAYMIEIKDRISLTPNLTSSNLPEFKPIFDSLKIQGSRYFFNGINTRTKGIDVNLNSDFHVGKNGTLKFLASASFFQTEIIGKVELPGVLKEYSDRVIDRDYLNRITKVQPGANYMGQINYEVKKIEALVRVNKYGDILFIHKSSDPQYDQTYKGKYIVDLEFTYHLTKKIHVTVGGHNILNSYPDKSIQIPGDYLTGKIRVYNWYSPYGFQGASYYGKLLFYL